MWSGMEIDVSVVLVWSLRLACGHTGVIWGQQRPQVLLGTMILRLLLLSKPMLWCCPPPLPPIATLTQWPKHDQMFLNRASQEGRRMFWSSLYGVLCIGGSTPIGEGGGKAISLSGSASNGGEVASLLLFGKLNGRLHIVMPPVSADRRA